MKIILSESENYDHDKFLLEGVVMEVDQYKLVSKSWLEFDSN